MTSAGFCSHFDNAPPPDGGRRVYYLKGGPGVGKSSFMRRVGRTAEKAGLRVEYFHCSSDSDSLDAVCLPQLGAALLDGTAPHVCDPVLPGARDTLLSLGDYLDTDRLRPLLGELRGLQGEIAGRYSLCRRYLTAAGEIDRAGAAGRENPRKAAALAEEWTAALPLRGGTGRARRLFGAAFTPKGLVRLTEDGFPRGAGGGRGEMGDSRGKTGGGRDKTGDSPNGAGDNPSAAWDNPGAPAGESAGDSAAPTGFQARTVLCPPGCRPSLTLARLSQAAVLRGLEPVELADPLLPEETVGLLLPEHDLYFGAALSAPGGETLPMDALFDPLPQREQERKYDRNLEELLLQRAVEQLREAKALHDELEKPYVAAMDFLKWQALLERVTEEIGLNGE